MSLNNDFVPYTSNELLEIFKEQHRLCSPLDFTADATFTLHRQTKVWEWRDALDLLEWGRLAKFLNQEFKIDVELRTWKNVLNPDDERTLGDICDFIATVARKEVIKPIRRMGADCYSAAVFLTLKKNLRSKGVNVSSLTPSTKIAPFLEQNFSPLIEEVTLTGLKTFDELKYQKPERERIVRYWLDKFLPSFVIRRLVDPGRIQTFRDLVERIVENKRLGMKG